MFEQGKFIKELEEFCFFPLAVRSDQVAFLRQESGNSTHLSTVAWPMVSMQSPVLKNDFTFVLGRKVGKKWLPFRFSGSSDERLLATFFSVAEASSARVPIWWYFFLGSFLFSEGFYVGGIGED